MELRTKIEFKGRMYLIWTHYDEVFGKYLVDIYKSDENGNINTNGEVFKWVTAKTKEEAKEIHLEWVLRMSI